MQCVTFSSTVFHESLLLFSRNHQASGVSFGFVQSVFVAACHPLYVFHAHNNWFKTKLKKNCRGVIQCRANLHVSARKKELKLKRNCRGVLQWFSVDSRQSSMQVLVKKKCITRYCHSHITWRQQNGFQRFLVPVYCWKLLKSLNLTLNHC